ncbi:MAG: magnesium transporter CorA family protein [Bacteroidales bacterium]|jgi:magnesium transporter|nr:magnesium transporter CorA family protein [Bacteroidales bacterium]
MMTFYTCDKGYEVTDKWEANCWTSLEVPTSEEWNFLVSGLEVPESFLSDIEDADERPRRDEDDGWQLIVLRVPIRRNESRIDFTTVPLGIIIKDDVCVTICNYKTDMLDDFVVYTIRKKINVANHYELAMRLMLSASVWFLKYLKNINVQMMSFEAELQGSVHNDEILRLQRIENSLVYFVTSLKGNDVLFYRLVHSKIFKDSCDEELTEDVEIELKQAEETTSIYRNIIHSMSNSYSSVISNNINATMKTLTSINIILLLPTFFASLYGMNVKNYLEDNPYAFFIVIGMSVFVSLMLSLFFRRKDLL